MPRVEMRGPVTRPHVAWMALLGLLLAASTSWTAFDPDADGDGHVDSSDNCDLIRNEQIDTDEDDVGDACDMCPATATGVPADQFGCSLAQLCPCEGPPNMSPAPWRQRSGYLRCIRRQTKRLVRIDAMRTRDRPGSIKAARATSCGKLKGGPGDRDGDGILEDGDGDGIPGNHRCTSRVTAACDDNCPGRRNRDQVDFDGDGRGNRCDGDLDGDDIRNPRDNCPLDPNVGQEDGDEDDVGDACDDCKDSEDDADVGRNGCD